MLSFIIWPLSTLLKWLPFDANPLDCLLQGLVGACGISVLGNLTRVHLFVEAESSSDEDGSKRGTPRHQGQAKAGWAGMLWFLLVMLLLAVVGSRVASLVVLEFSLRSVSVWFTSGPEQRFVLQLLVQCQFSLGCALSCSLHFLHEGAPQRWLCLILAVALSWFLARQARRLKHHVMILYKLHSSQRYCGVCISLLSSGCLLLPMLCRVLVATFSVAGIASISIINKHFLSATEALRFWTPLTICYTLLVVYMQDEQHRHPTGQAVLNTVVVRLGGLMVLMLTVGRWADVLHILVCFLGEASCLIPTMDLLDTTSSQDEDDHEDHMRRQSRQGVLAKENKHSS